MNTSDYPTSSAHIINHYPPVPHGPCLPRRYRIVANSCGVPRISLTEIGLRSRLEELVKHVSSNPKIGIDVEGARRMIGAK